MANVFLRRYDLSEMPANQATETSDSKHQRLLAEYHAATEKYSAAVGELSQHRAAMTKEDYDKLLGVVEDARTDCERVRKTLGVFHLQS